MKDTYRQQARKRAAIKAAIIAALMAAAAVTVAATSNEAPADAAERPQIVLTRIEAPRVAEMPASPARIVRDAESAESVATETAVIESVKASAPEILTHWDEIPLDADLQHYIVTMCIERDIDPAIIFAQIWRESTYQADVIGDHGNSFGLMQVQPRWHSARMDKLGVTDLLDPVQNVTVGIDYLDELLDRYGGDLAAALTAYNRGSYKGAVTQYALDVLAEAERMSADVLHR